MIIVQAEDVVTSERRRGARSKTVLRFVKAGGYVYIEDKGKGKLDRGSRGIGF
jgi:hypothetical protein